MAIDATSTRRDNSKSLEVFDMLPRSRPSAYPSNILRTPTCADVIFGWSQRWRERRGNKGRRIKRFPRTPSGEQTRQLRPQPRRPLSLVPPSHPLPAATAVKTIHCRCRIVRVRPRNCICQSDRRAFGQKSFLPSNLSHRLLVLSIDGTLKCRAYPLDVTELLVMKDGTAFLPFPLWTKSVSPLPFLRLPFTRATRQPGTHCHFFCPFFRPLATHQPACFFAGHLEKEWALLLSNILPCSSRSFSLTSGVSAPPTMVTPSD